MDNKSMTDERLERLIEKAQRGPLTTTQVQELIAEVRRLRVENSRYAALVEVLMRPQAPWWVISTITLTPGDFGFGWAIAQFIAANCQVVNPATGILYEPEAAGDHGSSQYDRGA